MITNCSICDETHETRYIDLFITESEGTRLCHDCEMLVVEFIRDKQRLTLEQRIHKAKSQHGTLEGD